MTIIICHFYDKNCCVYRLTNTLLYYSTKPNCSHFQILFYYTNREQAGTNNLPADLGQHVFFSLVVYSVAHLCSVTTLCRRPF